MIDSAPEHLHRRRETHIGIDKRRDIHAKFSDLRIQKTIVLREIIFGQHTVHIGLVGLDHQRFYRIDEFFLILEMLEQEILYKVPCLSVVFRIHSHFSEEIFHIRSFLYQGS